MPPKRPKTKLEARHVTGKEAAQDKRTYFKQADFPQSTLQQALWMPRVPPLCRLVPRGEVCAMWHRRLRLRVAMPGWERNGLPGIAVGALCGRLLRTVGRSGVPVGPANSG